MASSSTAEAPVAGDASSPPVAIVCVGMAGKLPLHRVQLSRF
jgi:hypothetical protein